MERGGQLVLLFFFCLGQGKDKFGSHALGADDVNMFVVRVDNFPDNGKAQTGALFVFAAGEVRFVKTVPDQFQAVSGDADAVVFDGDEYLIALFGRLDFNDRIIMAEFDGIIQEVIEYLLDSVVIGMDGKAFSGQHQFYADHFVRADDFKGNGGIADHFVDVKIRIFQKHSLCIEVI